MRIFLASYRTTIASFILAGLELYKNGVTGKDLAIAVAIIVFGFLAKDGNITMSQGYVPKTAAENENKK